MLRIGDQIGYAYQAHQPVDNREARKQAIDMLRQVGINDPERRVNAFAHELSGGMAQRALIAMALSSRTETADCRRADSGLDVTIQAQFLDEMWQTVQTTGSAILLVTQELGVIANYCDRVLVLHQGRIVEDAPVRDSSPIRAIPTARTSCACSAKRHGLPVVVARPGRGRTADPRRQSHQALPVRDRTRWSRRSTGWKSMSGPANAWDWSAKAGRARPPRAAA